MLNFNLLRVFHEVAITSSVTRAAERLFISQPAVSNDLKKLNELLGFTLLKSTSKGMILTQKGASLFEYVKKVFDIEKEMETFLLQIDEDKSGNLSIGLSTLYARYITPDLTKEFHSVFPGVNARFFSGNSSDILSRLKNFQIEIAIAAQYLDIPSIKYLPFRKEEIVLVASMKHDFVKRGKIFFQELDGERFIMKDEGSATGRTVKTAFEKRKIKPNIVAELANLDVILEMTEDNQGVTFLPALIVKHLEADKNLSTIKIEDKTLYFETFLAIQKDEKLSFAAQQILEMLRKYGGSSPI